MDVRSKEEKLNDTIKDFVANKFGYADWLQIEMVDFDCEIDYKNRKKEMESMFIDYKNLLKTVSDCL